MINVNGSGYVDYYDYGGEIENMGVLVGVDSGF